MAEAIGGFAVAVDLISQGITVTRYIIDYCEKHKNQEAGRDKILQRSRELQAIFEDLRTNLSKRPSSTDEVALIRSITASIESCKENIARLEEQCAKFTEETSIGFKASLRTFGRRALYPLRHKTMQSLVTDMDRIYATLSPTLDILQLNDTQTIRSDVIDVRSAIEEVKTSQSSTEIREWLKAPDTDTDHNIANELRQPGTGRWFVNSEQFCIFSSEPNSILWVKGFAGSGKSVLISTAIEYIREYKRPVDGVGLAYFYFKFNDQAKQDTSAMLKCLISQLSLQLPETTAELAQLWESRKFKAPSSAELLSCLRSVIQCFHEVFLILDAIDESPPDDRRERVLDTINAIREWSIRGLHFLMTSRNEPDIRNSLDLQTNYHVEMRNDNIDSDIATHVSAWLDTNGQKYRWLLPYRSKIQDSFTQKAQGVFRWVDCQLRTLRRCPQTKKDLDLLLESLPESLDETYERILCSVPSNCLGYARRILLFLCVAREPPTLQEVIEIAATDIGPPCKVVQDRRFSSFEGIEAICPGFFSLILEDPDDVTPTVHIAHFSVQQYLESERTHFSRASHLHVSRKVAHTEMAEVCLTNLLQFDLEPKELREAAIADVPLLSYATRYWYKHFENGDESSCRLQTLVTTFCLSPVAFRLYRNILKRGIRGEVRVGDALMIPLLSPLAQASAWGLDRIVHQIIGEERRDCMIDSYSSEEDDDNGLPRMISKSRALHEAAYEGFDSIIEYLLVNGADPNFIQRWDGGVLSLGLNQAPLHLAAAMNYDSTVRLLLKNGANPNVPAARSDSDGSPLVFAAAQGHTKIVETLLDHGANVNAEFQIGSALSVAAKERHVETLKLLLKAGANMERSSRALIEAARGGNLEIIELLIARLVNKKALNVAFMVAIRTFAFGMGDVQVVGIFLDNGADVNSRAWDKYKETWHTAVERTVIQGSTSSLELLIRKGADFDFEYLISKYINCTEDVKDILRAYKHLSKSRTEESAWGPYPSDCPEYATTYPNNNTRSLLRGRISPSFEDRFIEAELQSQKSCC